MKRKILFLCIGMIVLTVASYLYLNQSVDEQSDSVYLKTVVFKDGNDDLIPVSINFHSEVDIEKEVMNRINLMKSDELERYGLYPVLHSDLEVLSVNVKEGELTLNVNNLNGYEDDMDLLESLTFVLTDYDDVNQLKIQVDGEGINYLPDSQIPITSLNKNLGLNNFIETSSILHETIPVMAYNEKIIDQYSYYVPTTLRLKEDESIKNQVKTVLNHIQTRIQLEDATLDDGILKVSLGPNVLLENEKIDQTLEDLIVLSLSTLQDVKEVKIYINNEDVRTTESSITQYNYIKM